MNIGFKIVQFGTLSKTLISRSSAVAMTFNAKDILMEETNQQINICISFPVIQVSRPAGV